ncbi:MAG: MarR family transcriptional regulator [Planctomycetota bacterium]
MSLEHELGLRKGFEVTSHEAVLNIYYTASCIKKEADEFFRQYGLTDVQFNVLMLLSYQSGDEGGLSQVQLSEMMLVNRANITSLVDRMEKAKLVVRSSVSGDRRYNLVKLTGSGRKIFAKVEPLYAKRIRKMTAALKDSEQKRLIKMLESIRREL